LEVKEEEMPTALLLANSDGTFVDDQNLTSDDTVFNSGQEEASELAKDGLDNKNNEYMRDSSPTRRRCRVASSPFPPSSPPCWSPSSTRSPSPESFENPELWYQENLHEALGILEI
jgi:hypothetical protein